MKARWLSFIFMLVCSFQTQAGDYYLTTYHAKYTDDDLPDDILINQDIRFEDSYLVALALAREIDRPTPTRRWEAEFQVAKHFRQQNHWEFNALLTHRWHDFPWDKYLRTTMAIGNGFSQATETPPLEIASHSSTGAAAFLYYILMEITYQPPQVDTWSLVVRIHHRSGIKGLINNVNGGSNHVGVGLKWRF